MVTPPRDRRWLGVAVAAASPSLIVLVLVAALWKAGPRDFVPLWNDEVIYWNEAAVFARAGFEGGYITVAERPAAATWSRFGPHGPFVGVVYGSLARVVTWTPYTGYLAHLLLVPLCAGIWLSIAVPRGFPALTQPALLVATFWPLLLYLPTQMQEPLHFSLAFLFAALCERGVSGRRHIGAAVALVAFASLARPTWALIIPALLWGRGPNTARRIGSVFVSLAAFLAAFLVVTRSAAPYPHTSWVTAAVANPAVGIPLLLSRAAVGLRTFLQAHEYWYITALRAQVVVFFAAVAACWTRVAPDERWRLMTSVLALAPVILALLPAGDIESGREFHIIAPHVLIAMLIVGPLSRRWSAAAIAVNAVLCVALVPSFRDLHDGRFGNPGAVPRFADAVRDRVVFTPNAVSGWDNTILMHAEALQAPLAGLPFGIGVSYVLDWEDQAVPPRSRYLLLRGADEAFGQAMPLKRLGTTELGTLYENLDRHQK